MLSAEEKSAVLQEMRTVVVARSLELNEVETGLQASIQAVQVSYTCSFR